MKKKEARGLAYVLLSAYRTGFLDGVAEAVNSEELLLKKAQTAAEKYADDIIELIKGVV